MKNQIEKLIQTAIDLESHLMLRLRSAHNRSTVIKLMDPVYDIYEELSEGHIGIEEAPAAKATLLKSIKNLKIIKSEVA